MRVQKTILFVDDCDTTRDTFCIMLEHQKYAVITAQNGKEALEKLDQLHHKIDVIVTDHEMPLMDGTEFLTEFRKRPYSNIPIFMISSNLDVEKKQDLTKLGVKSFLDKPFPLKKFFDTIENLTFGIKTGMPALNFATGNRQFFLKAC